MNKLEKPVKGKNIKYLLDAFFNKYIRKHFNQVNSIDFIISDLGERMADGGRNIKILRNDNPVRTNNPDWFPPKSQQTDHICTFLKQLMDNELGTKDSYVGLKVEVITETKTYTWDVKAVDYYASSGTVILRTDPRQGVTIECPAIVRLYIYPLLTSKAVSSIIYNSIVTSESKYNFILGERNIHKGEDNVWIFGKNNISGETNHNSLINGYNNDVDSYGNIVIGDNNKHRSLLGATIGRYIKNFKQNSFLFGTGHDNTNGPSHEVVFGKYSNIEADTAFAIGDGEDENNRHNLFEVKYGGAILDKDGNDLRNRGGQQVQSDWNENDNTKPAFIKNKPTIPAAQQPADWNATKGPTRILNKPNIGINNSNILNAKLGDFVTNISIRISGNIFHSATIRYGYISHIIDDVLTINDAICNINFEGVTHLGNAACYIKSIKVPKIGGTKWVNVSDISGLKFIKYPFINEPSLKMVNNLTIDNAITIHCYNTSSGIIETNKVIFNLVILKLYEDLFNVDSPATFNTIIFDFRTTVLQHENEKNIYFWLGENKVYLLHNNSIIGRLVDVINNNKLIIRFNGIVPITSGPNTENILRKSIVSFELHITLDVSNRAVSSWEFVNFEELQINNNN